MKEKLSKYQEEKKSKEEKVKTLQEELHNSRQQVLASMEEAKSLKQEVVEFKEEVKKLKYQLTVSEKFKESTEALNKVINLPQIKQVLDIIIKDQAPSFMKMLKMLNVNMMLPKRHLGTRRITRK